MMKAKTVAISQSNYIPWKGYFDNIALVDEFVLYDDMQYTKRDWRNRNLIKTTSGTKWITIPVKVKGKFHQKINETEVSDPDWNEKHFNIISQNYKNAKCYDEVIDFVEHLYTSAVFTNLSLINHHFLSLICKFLGIDKPLRFSSEFQLTNSDKTQRLIDLCLKLGAGKYYTGSSAKNYMDEQLFNLQKMKVEYFDYTGYKEYDQLYDNFEHRVSILDLIFSEGKNAKNFLKYVK